MAFIADYAFDAALAKIQEGTRMDITSSEATTYTQATANPGTGYSLGNKTSVSIGSAADASPNGRKVQIAAITGGSATATGTAAYWALTDVANTRLLATGALSASQAVTNGNTFTLTATDVRIADAT